MKIKIHQIDHNSKYLKDVIALGDMNKKTLGLFPKEAFKESAGKKQIIVATDEDTGGLIGYLLFSTSRRKMIVSIVHLCVSEKYRGQGVAKLLFNELKKTTQDGYLGVRVHCRVDYPANKLWPKLDFVAVSEMKGRGKKETRLIIWKYEYPHQSLFSFTSLQDENAKVKVVIDANVFYQLQDSDDPDSEESLPLLAPWLDIELCITPEMLNEIVRNKDDNKRSLARKFARSFTTLEVKTSQNEFQDIHVELRPLFPETMKESDVSDLKQLSYAICARVPFFVTRDEPVLDKANDVFEKFLAT
jgi:GNAT superfamily N-acetyltransferase/predicted nucleic acid-binding protein